ncbi:MAG: 23S rRNA (adenine(2503)-C(2))-methyltransferase RlmN [Desulfatitalea sp.]|nr:23S rRNA (adenine(2503)-C(2))-methyltransferase RlmN [Desulfatitalea sp.]NNK00155.1 23S rRNA (adenine(2503)-C(2))-methyltransferase RlmN [Desulfatitalea sp.]
MLPDIKSLTPKTLGQWLAEQGQPAYRAEQILKWIYVRLADGFDQMTDLSKAFRGLLACRFTYGRLKIGQVRTAADGTRKFLFELQDGQHVESVLIPERNHDTLCVSSQVGCAQGCRFCLTGRGGLVRNLAFSEIVGQVWETRKQMDDPAHLTNLVFMGMGEPLANYTQLKSAIEMLTNSDWGMKFASRRVTVSTAGLVPNLLRLGQETRVNVAISLNEVHDEARTRLMPINRKYPLAQLLDACRRYPLPKGRKLTFEYILFKDVNDSPAHARRLAQLLAPLKAKINLIPFNPYPGSRFQRPDEASIQAFQAVLIQKHFTSVVRYSKGEDIMAACGQLRGMVVKSIE